MNPSIYLTGSLRNPAVLRIGEGLRDAGFDVFDEWFAAGPLADDAWRDYELGRKHTYTDALNGYAAKVVFAQDVFHLNRCHAGVMILPAGRSAHLEAGTLAAQGKPVFLLLNNGEVPERFDVMTQFLTAICHTHYEVVNRLRAYPWPSKLPTVNKIHVMEAHWLAGLLEVSGILDVVEGQPRLSLVHTDLEIITRTARLFGAKVARRSDSRWCVCVAGPKMIEWLRVLRPLLGAYWQHKILDIVGAWAAEQNSVDATFWRRMFRLQL